MQFEQREELIYRIVHSKQIIDVYGRWFELYAPSPEIKFEAAKVYSDTIRQNRFNTSWLTDKFCLRLLVQNGLCSAEIDKNLKTMEEEIENLKVALFKSIFTPELHKQNRKRLNLVRDKYNQMTNARHSFDHLTLKGYAETIKRQFLVFKTLHHQDGTLVWERQDDVDPFLLEAIINRVLAEAITPTQIREIARTEPWRGYWSIKKAAVFEQPVFSFTDEQKAVVLYSKMYDSAYEHPSCPNDDVIADDDIFDGWMISQHREREKERTTKEVNERLSNTKAGLANADEVFLVATDKNDARKIHSLNDTRGQIVKAQRKAVLKHRGKAVDSNFPDRKMQIQQQGHQQFIQNVKGK